VVPGDKLGLNHCHTIIIPAVNGRSRDGPGIKKKEQLTSYVLDVVRAKVPTLALDEVFEKKTISQRP